MRARGRPGGRGPPGTSAPTTNAPWPPCARATPAGERDAPAGRAQRPRRAARRGRPRCTHGDVPVDAGRRGRRPLPQTSRGRHAPVPPRQGNGMRRLVGRDVLGAPRARGRARCAQGTPALRARGRPGDAGRRGRRPLPQTPPWPPCARAAPAGERDAPAGRARRPRRAARRGRARGRPCAHGDVPGTRAAEDVGPYHKCPRGRHAPVPPRRGNGMCRLVGRDVLGAPRAGGRPRCTHGDVHAARTGAFRGRGPPGTSAPTMRYQANGMVIPEISMYPAGTVSW